MKNKIIFIPQDENKLRIKHFIEKKLFFCLLYTSYNLNISVVIKNLWLLHILYSYF